MKKLTFALALATGASSAFAANGTWTGGGASDNISEMGNWSGFVAAQTTGGTWTFDGSTRLTPVNDLAFNGTTDTGLTFAAGAGAFVLSGANNVRTGGITNSSANLQTIGLGARFNGTRTIDTGAAGILFSVTPASTGTGRTINKNGTGDLTFTFAGTTTNLNYNLNAGRIIMNNATGTQTLPGTVVAAASTTLVLAQAGTANVGGIISGAGSVRKTGSGGSTFSGANTYTGGTVVEAGTLTVANAFTMSGANGFNLSGAASPVAGTDNGSISTTGAFGYNYGGDLVLTFSGTAVNNADYDLFNFGGSTTIGGAFSTISIGGSYTIAASAPSGGIWSGTAGGFTFTFTEATGNLLVSAIPEPSAFAALAGVLGLGFAASRRRRSA